MDNIIKIREANFCDIPSIMEIMEENIIDIQSISSTNSSIGRGGFLLKRYDKKFFESSIKNHNHILLVSEIENKMIGYITGQHLDTVEEDLSQKLIPIIRKNNLSGKIFYYRQIAKRRNSHSIGFSMFKSLEEKLKNLEYDISICKIAHSPIENITSKKFHEKLGFKLISIIQENEKEFAIYIK